MPLDYASVLGAGQQLVPNLRAIALQDQQAQFQEQEIAARTQAMQAQQQKLAQAQQRQQQYQNDLDQVLLTGGDPRAIQRLMLKYPEFADNMKPVLDSMDKDQLQRNQTQLGTIFARGQAGDLKGAADALRQRIEADKAAGDNDPADQAVLDGLESGDAVQQKAALATVGIHLAALSGDKFAETYGKLNAPEATNPVQKEYDWRVAQFGKQAADQWLATQDTKLVPVQAGGQVYAYGPTGGTPQPEGGDQSASVMGYVRVANPDKAQWAKRADGSVKGMGWLGLLRRPDGGVSSEISVGIPASDLGGKGDREIEIPLMVPGLTKPELDYLMTHHPEAPDFQRNMPRSILAKASDFARERLAQGKSPFRQDNEGDAAPSQFAMPVQGGAFTSSFGDSRDGGKRRHDGQDIAAPAGTPVTPIAAGKVVAVGQDPMNGNFVRIKHPDGTVSGYGHLGHQVVSVGQDVTPDTQIGVVGATGNATGNVLHLTVRRNGRAVDPRPLLGIAVVRTKQDYDRLPSRTRYIAPDGSHRVKS